MSREEALSTLEEGRARVDGLLAALTDEDFERPKTIGGGDWSARDLVGHLAYWEELAQHAADDWRAGRVPGMEEVFRNDRIDQINAENATCGREMTAVEVRERAARAHAAIVETTATMSDEEWSQKSGYETERRRTVGMLLASILGAPKRGFGHAFAHIPDLEAYVESLTR